MQGPHRDRPTNDSSQLKYSTFRMLTGLRFALTDALIACTTPPADAGVSHHFWALIVTGE